MNKIDLQKLIREEVRKVIKERSSLNEATDKQLKDAIKGIKLMVHGFRQMPGEEQKAVNLIKGQVATGIMKMIADVMAKGTFNPDKLDIVKDISRKLNAANTLDTVEAEMIGILEFLADEIAKMK